MTEACEALGPLRRRPVQRRAKFAVDVVLTAARRALTTGKSKNAELPSTNTLARIAGISIGTLYRYFPDKQSVLCALAERVYEEELAAFRARLVALRTAPLGDFVREAIRFSLSVYQRDASLKRSLAEGVRLHSSPVLLRRVMRPFIRTLAEELEHRRSELSVGDYQAASVIMALTVEQLVFQHVVEPLHVRGDDALVEEITRMFTGYIARPR